MRYEIPTIIVVQAAIQTINDVCGKLGNPPAESVDYDGLGSGYEDWE